MASPLVQALSFQNAAHPAQSGINPTDVVGAYNLASNVAQKNYEAKIAQQNAKFGGMAQLGGAGISALGPKAYTALMGAPATGPLGSTAATPGLIPGMFGSGATAASTPAAAAAPTVAADIGAASSPANVGGLFSSMFGPSATLGSAGAGTVASDIAAAAPAAEAGAAGLGDAAAVGGALGSGGALGGIGDAVASAGLPEWLASFLPFLALA